jgi:hypothetical protein
MINALVSKGLLIFDIYSAEGYLDAQQGGSYAM